VRQERIDFSAAEIADLDMPALSAFNLRKWIGSTEEP